MQVAALHLGALAIVQPLLTTGLLFALVARRVHDHSQVSPVQLLWAVLFCAALGGFVWLAAAGGDATRETADRLPAVIAGVIGAMLAAACVEVGRRQKTTGRGAALLGVAVGVIYAGTAALIKAVTDIGVAHPLRVLISWQLYLALAAGAAGLLLSQLAFQAAPLTASLPASASVDPLLSIVVGVAVYDEHIRRGPGAGAVLLALLFVLGVAVVQLAREPDARPGRRAVREAPSRSPWPPPPRPSPAGIGPRSPPKFGRPRLVFAARSVTSSSTSATGPQTPRRPRRRPHPPPLRLRGRPPPLPWPPAAPTCSFFFFFFFFFFRVPPFPVGQFRRLTSKRCSQLHAADPSAARPPTHQVPLQY